MELIVIVGGIGTSILFIHTLAKAFFRLFGVIWWQAVLLAWPLMIAGVLPIALLMVGYGDTSPWESLSHLYHWCALLTIVVTYRTCKASAAENRS